MAATAQRPRITAILPLAVGPSALEARENTARITLDDSATSAAVLGRLLTALREDRYDYHVAVETEF